VVGVLDIDSDRLGTFDAVDAELLPGILALIHT
jgi:putative methionine-R-sulfoxide reductase with GAF domain